MDAHTRKTLDSILGSPAPRELEWARFITLWKNLADEVDEESGDRLAVRMNGHRVVFHRPHNGRVAIGDIERARHLLASSPDLKGHGHACVVAIDAKSARLICFNLDAEKVDEASHTVHDGDPRAHHLRTVERHTGNDDVADLTHFFDEVAEHVGTDFGAQRFAVLGHGAGKSDVAALFIERLQKKHHPLAQRLAGVGDIDLSAANDAQLEAAAVRLLSE